MPSRTPPRLAAGTSTPAAGGPACALAPASAVARTATITHTRRILRRTVDDLLADARARIRRYEPAEARAAVRNGALIVDLRSADERRRDGVVPGSLHVTRRVLEWRADPASAWHNPRLGGLERELILLCAHGYSSSLAAATLVELGFERAGDVVGGFEAWRAEGVPVVAAPLQHDGLPGSGPPD
jgi:rhodanese-related sulfurtransferase